jgi:hypothetical protein
VDSEVDITKDFKAATVVPKVDMADKVSSTKDNLWVTSVKVISHHRKDSNSDFRL